MLFIRTGKDGSCVKDVAAGVFSALGLRQSEERESLNYPPNMHYFVAYAQNACVKVYDDDDDAKPDFPFRVSVQQPWRDGVGTVETDLKRMAILLASAGFHVFLPHGDWCNADWDGAGEVYTA